MDQVRRSRPAAKGIAALALAVAAITAGCGTSDGPEAVADPRPTTTATSQPATDPGADEVVWQEVTGGGFVPAELAANTVPDVTIYGDGRIFVTAHGAEGQVGPPVALEQATVPRDELEAFLSDAEGSGLFDPGTDFGSPGVTDQPSTTVVLRTGPAPQQVDVYALDFSGDVPVGDVSAEQADRRDQLRALLGRARKLAEGAEPYVPDRVRAVLFDPAVAVGQPGSGAPWPGPPLSSFPPLDDRGQSCLVVEGDDATAVYQADQDNAETTWDLGGDVRTVVIVPLLPGQEGCPPG